MGKSWKSRFIKLKCGKITATIVVAIFHSSMKYIIFCVSFFDRIIFFFLTRGIYMVRSFKNGNWQNKKWNDEQIIRNNNKCIKFKEEKKYSMTEDRKQKLKEYRECEKERLCQSVSENNELWHNEKGQKCAQFLNVVRVRLTDQNSIIEFLFIPIRSTNRDTRCKIQYPTPNTHTHCRK